MWPENVAAWRLWLSVQTQWRVGLGGRTGLDYAGVEAVMRLHRCTGRRAERAFARLQAMEHAALQAWAEQREQGR